MLTGQNLVNELRRLSDNIQHRLWIVSPFLGNPNDIQCILGNKWLESNVDLRLLTDIGNESSVNSESIRLFYKNINAKVRSLRGLHAKLYIVDDSILVTSANLSGTAFSHRFEIGEIKKLDKELEEIFNIWWNYHETQEVPKDWQSKIIQKNTGDIENSNFEGLKKQFDLPPMPESIKPNKPKKQFFNYEDFLNYYEDLTIIYYSNQMLWESSKKYKYFEVDSFLNYLLHHDTKPSLPYFRDWNKFNSINNLQRKDLIKKYATLFAQKMKKMTPKDKGYREFTEERRKEESKIIRVNLAPNEINKLNTILIGQVISCLDCIKSGGHIDSFINKNKDIKLIIKSWSELLHNENEHIETRMTNYLTKYKLKAFDYSSIQELIGYYFPEKYPKRNRLVNAGLRFLGYDLKELPPAID